MSKIAIIGFQGRFPGGAATTSQFFGQLLEARCFCGEVPPDRWSAGRFVASDRAAGKTEAGRGHFLDHDYRGFDPDVFGFSPDEIAGLDPQQRLVLEVAFEALETAGLDPFGLAGQDVGVYVGGFTTDHLLNQFSAQARSALGRFSAAGSTLAMLANRLSYALDLRGPSLTVDTACASSLTALALAVRDLEAGACGMALAGGVSVMLRPEYQIAMSAAGLLAADGRCKPFSSLADGYGRGEGCGVVVLKRLADALADDDPVVAVVEAVATGHGGRSAGISAPNGDAQAAVMRRALAACGLAARDIGYVEAHGTGTVQGDLVEARSIGAVYGHGSPDHASGDDRSGRHASGDHGARRGAVAIGSMKANIGHLEAAAGIAGVIKAVLICRERRVPPHLLVGHRNPAIPFSALGLRLPEACEPLEAPHVAVNAFGYGGSSAHAIIGPAPCRTTVAEGPPEAFGPALLPLSAQSAEALAAWLPRLADHAETASPVDLLHTLARRRGHRAHRGAVWVERDEAPAAIAAKIRAVRPADCRRCDMAAAGEPRTLLVFSGMGAQWPGMGRDLLAREPVFRDAMEEIDAAFRPLAGVSLIDAMGVAGNDRTRLDGRIGQPASFALQVALAKLLARYGVEPDICLGHSAGEVAAAHCAGHLTLEQALVVSWARTDLQTRRAGHGGMLAAALGEAEAETLCARLPGLEVAAVNAVASITLAGRNAVLSEAEGELHRQGVPFRRLDGDIAYHSANMDPILGELGDRLAGLVPRPPEIPLVSSVTGRRLSGDDVMDGPYWCRNVRAPVRFRAALEAAFALGATHCLEIGPKPVLRSPVQKAVGAQARRIAVIAVLDGQEDERGAMRQAIGRFHLSGGRIDWKRMAPGGSPCPLPVTGWHRRRLWREAEVQAHDRLGDPAASPWAEPAPVPRSWIADLNREVFAFLGDHRIEGVAILPGTAAMEAALRTALAVRDTDAPALPVRLADIRFHTPFRLDRRQGQVLDTRHLGGGLEVLACDPACPSGALRVLSAQIAAAPPGDAPMADAWHRPEARPIAALAAAAPHPLETDRHQARLAALGLAHGPAFRVVRSLSLAADGRTVLAQLAVDRSVSGEPSVQTAPCLLDGVLQAALALTVACEPLVPAGIDAYTLHGELPPSLWAMVSLRDHRGRGLRFDARLYDRAGHCLAEMDGIVVKPLRPAPETAPLPELSLITRWEETQATCSAAIGRRVAVLASDGPDGALLERAWAEMGGLAAKDDASEATVVVVPDGPRPLADRLGDLLALADDPARGRLYLITRNATSACGADLPVQPEQAAVWGLGRTLCNELAASGTTLVDVARDEPWHMAVAAEIASFGKSSEVAFRRGRRLLPRLRPALLPPDWDGSVRFHRSRAYLITGGLGGFGQQLALWLARRGAGRIVATSRGRPPQARIAPLAREIAALGSQLHVETLDPADRRAVRLTLERLASADMALAGIFHWAGATADRAAAALTIEDLQRVLRPKAEGAEALDLASRDLSLDHFVLASSLSALTGNPRQANYAAANAYLDGLALARHKAGLPALSVNFGPVAGAGMAADPAVAAHLVAAGMPAMTMASALAGLGAAMGAGLAQVSLSRPIDWGRWARYDPRAAQTDRMAFFREGTVASGGTRPDLRSDLGRHPAGQRPRVVAEHLGPILAEVLKAAPGQVSADIPLTRMGLDSLGAVEMQRLIEERFGVLLPITILIGGDSLAAIGAIIADDLAEPAK